MKGRYLVQRRAGEAYIAAVHKRYGPYADRLLKLYPGTEAQWRQSRYGSHP